MNANKALWEKGDFTRLAATMRESGEELIDSLEALPAGARRRIFGAGRATEEGGTLTVIATVGAEPEPLRWATTRVVLEPGGKSRMGGGIPNPKPEHQP